MGIVVGATVVMPSRYCTVHSTSLHRTYQVPQTAEDRPNLCNNATRSSNNQSRFNHTVRVSCWKINSFATVYDLVALQLSSHASSGGIFTSFICSGLNARRITTPSLERVGFRLRPWACTFFVLRLPEVPFFLASRTVSELTKTKTACKVKLMHVCGLAACEVQL